MVYLKTNLFSLYLSARIEDHHKETVVRRCHDEIGIQHPRKRVCSIAVWTEAWAACVHEEQNFINKGTLYLLST